MKWILCDERLPKEGQMVLTTIRGHDVIIVQDEETFEEAIERVWNEVCYVSVGFIGSDGWYGADGYPLIVHPIAWMPLPKPYTADRKTEPQTETQTETQNSNLTFEKVMEEIQTQVIEFSDTHQKFVFTRKIEMDGDSIKICDWEYKGVKDGEREGE